MDVNDILNGRVLLKNLPSIKTRVFRLYLCALFSDTIDEQNELVKNVIPELREFCMNRYGIEFQVVNLSWGVHEESVDYKILFDNCTKEIEKCKELSIGSIFLALIGDKCGHAMLPLSMTRQNFDILIQNMNESKLDSSLIKNFYKINKNYSDNKYELVYDKNISEEVQLNLIEQLKAARNLAVKRGLLDAQFLSELDETLLERFLNKGAFNIYDKIDQVFTYIGLSSDLVNQKLEFIREKLINRHIPAEQIYRIRKTRGFLSNFADNYKKLFKKLVEKFIQKNPEHKYPSYYEDALRHFHYVKENTLNDMIVGSERALKYMRDYIFDATHRKPIVLYGPIGSGKTSCLATFASTLHLQLKASENNSSASQNLILVRFIGADRKSMDLRSLLTSMCLQLNAIFNQNKLEIPKKLNDLKAFFRDFLTKTSSNEKLTILIDSLQDLSPNDNAHKLDWLPQDLRVNCKLILTTSIENKELFERLKHKYTESTSYHCLGFLSPHQARYMLKKFLDLNNRRLESNQLDLIHTLLLNSNMLSLHLKLLSNEFLHWKSGTPMNECVLKATVHEAIDYYFSCLEKSYGTQQVRAILCYITISRTGLSECELQDILSLDNNLLKDLLPQLNQPQNILQMPWLFILPLLHDLQKHLIFRPDNGVHVIYWRHELFAQKVNHKYLDSNTDLIKQLHSNIAEYFMGTWSSSKSFDYEILKETERPSTKFESFSSTNKVRHKVSFDANRLVPKQPILYESFHTNISQRFNLRKLAMLPYHMIKANMVKNLFDEIFFNLEWIYCKIRAFDLQSLLNDFELYKSSADVNLLCEALKMSANALLENVNLLFIEMSGRLLPYYNLYPNIKKLIDQCDAWSHKYNPIVSLGQIYKAPSWIVQENFKMDITLTDHIQIELLESEFFGKILMAKNLDSPVTKFYDLDVMDKKESICTDRGIVYATRNGEFVCTLETNSKLNIYRVENGSLYGQVEFTFSEIGNLSLSNRYAALLVRKAPSPIVIDLKQSKLIKTLPYQCNFCFVSNDDSVLLVHNENSINYHRLPSCDRLLALKSREIPEKVLFNRDNSKLFVLSRVTKQLTYFSIYLEKHHYNSQQVIQDADIFDLKLTPDECLLLVCTYSCVYVMDTKKDCVLVHKLRGDIPNLMSESDSGSRTTSDAHSTSLSVLSNSPMMSNHNEISLIKNVFTGFGCTLDNQIIYATYYTYLFCWDASTGLLLRLFQSSLAANRIVKSYSSSLSDSLISVLDNGSFIYWNLTSLDKNIEFEDMSTFSNPIVDCLLPTISHDSKDNSGVMLSYCGASPDAKIHELKSGLPVKSLLTTCYNEKIDNPLTTRIRSMCCDERGRYFFIVVDIEDFSGKRLPEESDFLKRVGSLIDIKYPSVILEKFSYIIRKKSRFDLQAQFITKSAQEIYLLLQITSCFDDFDPYSNPNSYDWTEFETNIKLYGPLNSSSSELVLFDEFKLMGEPLKKTISITNRFVFVELMQECHKLIDKDQPSKIKAKRHEIHLCIYELFDYKHQHIPVQLFDLNELLTQEEYSHKNCFLDFQVMNDGNLLLIYSKEGSMLEKSEYNIVANRYEYDYETFSFKRDIRTSKGALIYDPIKNIILKRFPSLFETDTNVNELKISRDYLIMDNCCKLYDLRNGKVFNSLPPNLDYKLLQFLFNGRYVVSSSSDRTRVLIIRCNDNHLVASLFVYDKVSLIKLGESDRTLIIGTRHGYLMSLKIVVDLELTEAQEKFVKCYRLTKRAAEARTLKEYSSSTASENILLFSNSKISDTNNSYKLLSEGDKFSYLDGDIKRLINSAHEHRRLKSRESNSRACSSQSMSLHLASQSQVINQHDSGQQQNRLQTKLNLANLAYGLKYAHPNVTTRACCIQ